jgi:uncharacterized lipoprotein YmbA
VTGCASTKPSHFYTLNPTAAAAGAATPYAVAVGPVTVPAVVDRPQIVIRTGPNQVAFDEFNRWAAPLTAAIARVVAEDLSALLGTPQVTVFPQAVIADASYRVVIDILAFESEPGKSSTLEALWTVSPPKDGPSLRRRTAIAEPAPGGGYADLATAHSRALGRLSAEIAAAVREMETQKK